MTIGIDMGATQLRVGLINNGEIIALHKTLIKKNCHQHDIIEQIIEQLLKIDLSYVETLGIGVPGVVSASEGIVYDVQNVPSWTEVNLKNILENRFNIPVEVNNDANCFILGESLYGHAKGYNNSAGLTLGSGLGSGFIINGQLANGANCGFGEIGMLPYKEGILEHYASGMFFTREIGIDGGEVYKKALNGDDPSIKAYEQYGYHLGQAIKIVMYAYDPQIIILGGSISRAFFLFEKSMRTAMQEFAYSKTLEKIKIEISKNENIAIIGASLL